jgi:hypothetical protein
LRTELKGEAHALLTIALLPLRLVLRLALPAEGSGVALVALAHLSLVLLQNPLELHRSKVADVYNVRVLKVLHARLLLFSYHIIDHIVTHITSQKFSIHASADTRLE